MPAAPGYAERLKAAMDRQRVNKLQLSREAGVGRPTLDRWLAGEVPVKPGPVQAVADVLRVSFAELWGSASLELDERTRLMRLEELARRMRALGREVEELLEPDEPADAAPPERRIDAEGELPPPPAAPARLRPRRPRQGR